MENKVNATVNSQVFLEMYSEADDWADTLDFNSGELRFFGKVIRLYLQGIDKESRDRIEQLTGALANLNEKRQDIQGEITSHKDLLDDYIKDKKGEESKMLGRHDSLRSTYNSYIKQVRQFKDELFSMIDEI